MSTNGTSASGSNKIQRRPFVAELLKRRGNTLVIPGLGSPTWDCFAAGDSPEYLYSWGGMGLAVPTALGVALAQPSRRVLAITGDGELLMGIGSLGVVAGQNPPNLTNLVPGNEQFGATASQSEHTSDKVGLCAVARRAGLERRWRVTVQGTDDELAVFLFRRSSTGCVVAKIALCAGPRRRPVKDGGTSARRF